MSTSIGSGFRGAGGRLGYLLRQAQQAMHGAIEQEVREYGLTAPQFSLMSALRHEPGVSVTELAQNSMLTQQTTSEIVRLLEAKGFVERSPDPSDRRIGRLQLTEAGRKSLLAADRRVRRVEERVLADVPEADRERLTALLVGCARVLRDEREERRAQARDTGKSRNGPR
ncbi:MAG TPA: MarR family transcriptional regulator [Baekduia sp.]|nr:MarR family transcriptional regulator [Baekduia sp.]